MNGGDNSQNSRAKMHHVHHLWAQTSKWTGETLQPRESPASAAEAQAQWRQQVLRGLKCWDRKICNFVLENSHFLPNRRVQWCQERGKMVHDAIMNLIAYLSFPWALSFPVNLGRLFLKIWFVLNQKWWHVLMTVIWQFTLVVLWKQFSKFYLVSHSWWNMIIVFVNYLW